MSAQRSAPRFQGATFVEDSTHCLRHATGMFWSITLVAPERVHNKLILGQYCIGNEGFVAA
jgi:hypothetical protein